MTPELKTVRKKRTTSEAKPTSDGDHRKRRRNRTTQSCLNCHTSKRMCDRKRPCGRCTQLGLTGLCVYEVDDPSQRTDVRDESLHLRQRVAELEGVIRELKNKPHPRWVQANSTPEVEFERSHSHSQSRSAAEQQRTGQQTKAKSTSSSSTCPSSTSPLSTSPSSIACSISSPRNESHPSPQPPSSPHPCSGLTFPQPPADLTNTSAPSFPYFGSTSSTLSTPSPPIMMPIDECMQTRAPVPGEQSLAGELDFASIFMSYSDLIGSEDNLGYNIINGHLDDTYRSQHRYGTSAHRDSYCGCLTEGSCYNVVLELSLRLRKAAAILSRSEYHHIGSHNCALIQRIIELDGLAMATLGNITTSPNDINQIYSQRHKFIPPSSTLGTVSGRAMPASTVSPQTPQGLSAWDIILSSASNSSSICEDSLMSWEPSRRG
ncbi:hypothetical protein BDR04DRAFT_13433 [Suillus decipiens]|nr:hypothetical protein BDR04DRAFT_13433 [Suillus decipiens]